MFSKLNLEWGLRWMKDDHAYAGGGGVVVLVVILQLVLFVVVFVIIFYKLPLKK